MHDFLDTMRGYDKLTADKNKRRPDDFKALDSFLKPQNEP